MGLTPRSDHALDPAAPGHHRDAPGPGRAARRHPQGHRAGHRHHLPGLLQQGRDAGTAYAAVIPAYVVIALIFIVINYGLTVLAGRVERRINRRGRASGGTITNAMPGAPGGSGAMASTGWPATTCRTSTRGPEAREDEEGLGSRRTPNFRGCPWPVRVMQPGDLARYRRR